MNQIEKVQPMKNVPAYLEFGDDGKVYVYACIGLPLTLGAELLEHMARIVRDRDARAALALAKGE